jgi:hypothetical protein
VIGLYREHGAVDLLASLLALPVSLGLRLGHERNDSGVPRRAPDLTLRAIRSHVDEVLPGATLRRRLLWRYTVLYRAPRP